MAKKDKKVSIRLPIVLYKLRRREETPTIGCSIIWRDILKGERNEIQSP
jgi:hypothetical protein